MIMVICVLLYQLLHVVKMGSSWYVCSLLKNLVPQIMVYQALKLKLLS